MQWLLTRLSAKVFNAVVLAFGLVLVMAKILSFRARETQFFVSLMQEAHKLLVRLGQDALTPDAPPLHTPFQSTLLANCTTYFKGVPAIQLAPAVWPSVQ
jgi:hypothetical protein